MAGVITGGSGTTHRLGHRDPGGIGCTPSPAHMGVTLQPRQEHQPGARGSLPMLPRVWLPWSPAPWAPAPFTLQLVQVPGLGPARLLALGVVVVRLARVRLVLPPGTLGQQQLRRERAGHLEPRGRCQWRAMGRKLTSGSNGCRTPGFYASPGRGAGHWLTRAEV